MWSGNASSTNFLDIRTEVDRSASLSYKPNTCTFVFILLYRYRCLLQPHSCLCRITKNGDKYGNADYYSSIMTNSSNQVSTDDRSAGKSCWMSRFPLRGFSILPAACYD